jgi:hypothetical protein
VAAEQPHAVKDLLREELEALKAGELDGYAARFLCPAGVLCLGPQEGHPTRILTLANVEAAVRKEAMRLQKTCRMETARFEDVGAIVSGAVAVVCGQFAVEPRDPNAETIRFPIGLKIYVQLNGKWRMAAGFPGDMEVGRELR